MSITSIKAQVCGAYPPVKSFWWGNPDPMDFAFSQDSINLFNTDTARVYQGVDTIIDYQYLMPKKFDASSQSGGLIGIVDVQTITVSNVAGLPSGMNYNLDQAGASNGNSYNPQSNRFGAVRLCGTTFAQPAVYTIAITITADVGVGSGNETILLYLEVLPSPAGNPYYSYSPALGCNVVDVDFEAVIPSPNPIINPITYEWDFTNDGTVDATGTTANFQYTSVGQNEVNMIYSIDEFYISAASMSVSNADGCFCDAFIVTCLNAPEPYLKINTGSGDVSLSPGSGTTPSWTGLNIPITSTAISVQFWEDDDPLADDQFGSDIEVLTMTPNNGQTFTFSTGCGTATLVLSRRQQSQDNYVDTITVYSTSNTPTITSASGIFTACTGDSVVLQASNAGSYTWYKDSVAIAGATNQNLVVYTDGIYSVEVIDSGNICLSEQTYVQVDFESVTTPTIMVSSSGGLYVDNPNGYDVQWYANGSGTAIPIPNATSDTLATFNPLNAPFTVSFTSPLGCDALSAPFAVCIAGSSSTDANFLELGGSVTISHEDFYLNNGFDVAWAISTEADGPVTDMTSLQTAIDNGWVIPSTNDSGVVVNCSSLPDGVENGNYYFTPISAEALVIDSIIHQPLIDSGCITNAMLCLELSATQGVLLIADSLIFTFPDGSTANLRDIVPADFQSLIPDTIEKGLIDLLPSVVPGGSLCFPLTGLYSGDPNGTWSISALNVGSGSLTLEVPDIISTVYADSCPIISQDQVITIPGFTVNIAPNSSSSVSFTLPPLPSNFPTINSACNVIGSATMLTVDCETAIEEVIDEGSLTLYPNPNSGSFTLKMDILRESNVKYAVYDIAGRNVFTKDLGMQNGVVFESVNMQNNLGTGFYVISINIDGNIIQRHFIVK